LRAEREMRVMPGPMASILRRARALGASKRVD
jgi:hypothetical protein